LIRFSHIYIEENAHEYEVTSSILSKYPQATQIEIQNYKNIFNRPNQSFLEQKESMKLILAVKKDNFYYKGSEVVNNYGFEKFYYNTLILNCVYNCEYCYLQGMFNSGNVVVFVNIDDFFLETEKLLDQNGSVYLCISYETDILAFEDLIPYTSAWIEFARKHPTLVLEIRTKSTQYKMIRHLQPIENVILAWTVSPEEIIKKYEENTPTLSKRLQDIQSASQDGWKIRICLDPILHVKGWKEIYGNLVSKIFSVISPDKIFDISIGSFRINADYLKKIKKIRFNSDIIYYPFERSGRLSVYPENKVKEILEYMVSQIAEFYDKNRIYPTY
jgi:spore photoproduct lyase